MRVIRIVLLLRTAVILLLAGCGLMPETPELREVVRLTDTHGAAAEDIPEKHQTPEVDNYSNPITQLKETIQPTKQKIPDADIQPEIAISPREIAQGTKILIEGRGFPSGVEVQLVFGRINSEFDLIYKIQAIHEGDFSTDLEVPDFVNPEDSWVVVAVADDLRIKVFSDELRFDE